MQVKITNTNYGYLGEGKINFSATVEIQDDTGTVLHSTGISVRKNISATGWKTAAIADLIKQAQKVFDDYKTIMAVLNTQWATATSPADVLTEISKEVEGGIKL